MDFESIKFVIENSIVSKKRKMASIQKTNIEYT